MPDDKRTFDLQTLMVKSVQPEGQAKVRSGHIKMKSCLEKDLLFPFSKDVILRLIDWFERK